MNPNCPESRGGKPAPGRPQYVPVPVNQRPRRDDGRPRLDEGRPEPRDRLDELLGLLRTPDGRPCIMLCMILARTSGGIERNDEGLEAEGDVDERLLVGLFDWLVDCSIAASTFWTASGFARCSETTCTSSA